METIEKIPELLENFQTLAGILVAVLSAALAFFKTKKTEAQGLLKQEKKEWEQAKDDGVRNGILPWAVKKLHQGSAFKKLVTGKSKKEKRKALKELIVSGIYAQLGQKAAGELTPERLEQYADWGVAMWHERGHLLKGEFAEMIEGIWEDMPDAEPANIIGTLTTRVEAAEGNVPGLRSEPTSTPSELPAGLVGEDSAE